MSTYIRVNMSTGSARWIPLPFELETSGGRGLVAKLLCSEMDPTAPPLSAENVLIIATGLLAGSGAPCTGRVSIGAKSPLTGCIKESNAGGTTGLALARHGLRAVVITGQTPVKTDPILSDSCPLQVLVIRKSGVSLEDGSACQGLGTYAVCAALRKVYGETASVLCAGPAGERGYFNASVQATDRQGRPARAAARGGLGAVMATKGLKAVVVVDDGCEKPVFYNKVRFKEAQKRYLVALREHPLTGQAFPQLGTAMLVNVINEMGALPTNNYSRGRFEGAEGLSAEHMAQTQQARNGQMRHACQAGCPIGCSNVYHGPDGAYLTSGIEFETIALNGSNLGIQDLDTVATIDRLCDDAGLDTMETGVTLGLAMEAGLLAFGDGEGAVALVRQMAAGSPLGREMGQGAARFGKGRGVRRIPTVKQQALSGYDPRALKGTGVTYATSPMGADHTAGNTLGVPGLDPLSKEGQAAASLNAQRGMAVFDCLGMCIFAGMPAADPAVFALLGEMMAGVYGDIWTVERTLQLGSECLSLERAFNTWAGLPPEADDLPAFMREEPLAPHNTVFDVEKDVLQRLFDM